MPGGTEALGAWNKGGARWDGPRSVYPEVSMGTSYVQAVGFDGGSCPVTARTLLTYSQSDDPASAHASDQTGLFSNGRMIRGRFCERDVLASPGLRVVRVAQR
ncbi:penicillin acylase family protein [Streptomyces sp. NPDC021100]|uniref:penicillin acylase family protein n=1 Tax=Streptomyces sp. NPDC021100 TaxID=3365114 RepID=UPI00379E81AB